MPTGTNVSPELVQEIAKLTTEGLLAREVAARLGLNVSTVLHHRPAGAQRRNKTTANVQKWFEFYSQGWSINETGRWFGITGQTVRTAFRQAGFPIRQSAP